ncbi:hypothetical protein Taro_014272 [Colocasia esculenta]|uniref:Uncharacterized protein n=1 Tax=Colocasia esculenta TaxID=4460 RepID=A0A843UHT0_COLES|nr:hypothetical protein [Colocasia esculenta]
MEYTLRIRRPLVSTLVDLVSTHCPKTAHKHCVDTSKGSEQGEALAPRPAEEKQDKEPTFPSIEEEGDQAPVAIKKAPPSTSRSDQGIATTSVSHYQFIPSEFLSALRFWVRRRHHQRRNQNSDIHHVAISVL